MGEDGPERAGIFSAADSGAPTHRKRMARGAQAALAALLLAAVVTGTVVVVGGPLGTHGTHVRPAPTPLPPGMVQRFALDETPSDLAADHDGNIWITGDDKVVILRVT